MTIESQSTLCKLRHWVELDRGYDLEFPIEELGNAIAICGWTASSRVSPQSDEVRAELHRLEQLGPLDIPDGRRWVKRFGQPLQRDERQRLADTYAKRPDPGPRMGEDNYRDGDGEGYIP